MVWVSPQADIGTVRQSDALVCRERDNILQFDWNIKNSKVPMLILRPNL